MGCVILGLICCFRMAYTQKFQNSPSLFCLGLGFKSQDDGGYGFLVGSFTKDRLVGGCDVKNVRIGDSCLPEFCLGESSNRSCVNLVLLSLTPLHWSRITSMDILVTGGAGYIGSTVCSALEDRGHVPIILDSLVNGRAEFVRDRAHFFGDIGDQVLLERIFAEFPNIKCTVHCAALVTVGESVLKPYLYYRENVQKSMALFNNLASMGKKEVIFSSSAAVYDFDKHFKVTEDSAIRPLSPYSRSKLIAELILEDMCTAELLNGITLRYFNPIGADPRLRTGMHLRYPSHVMGKLVDTALGKQQYFDLTGVDWKTRDGSGLRDYFHVWDLAMAHVMAAENFSQVLEKARSETMNDELNYLIINLGSGTGVTVKELISSFEAVYRKRLRIRELPARSGDIAGSFADITRAYKYLDWKPELTLYQAIESALEWGKKRKSLLGYE
jgi:UDP-glucose 4-epimerase